MDAYLASGSLRDSYNFFFNVNFEFLNGCQFNCKGCHVNKNGAQAMTDEFHTQLMSILDSFDEKNHYKPFIAFIAPTDFLSANNTYALLTDKRVIEILNRFKRISFQTTYLDISKASLIADVLRDHYSNLELEINIIVEPGHIDKPKYLDMLKQNQEKVIEMMDWPTPVRSFGIMNVFDYDTRAIAELLRDYDFMHKKIEHLFETTIDFNFSLGRKDEGLTSDEFTEAAMRIKDMFNGSVVSNEKGQYLRFSFGKLDDSLIEKQYNWKNGEFYYSPLLYERYVSFIDQLKIETPNYHSKDFEAFEESTQMSQYLNVEDKDECGDCPYLGNCVDRGILHLMDIHGIKECLVAKQAMDVVNSKC